MSPIWIFLTVVVVLKEQKQFLWYMYKYIWRKVEIYHAICKDKNTYEDKITRA